MKLIRTFIVFHMIYIGLVFVKSSRELAFRKKSTQSSTYQEYVQGILTKYDAGRAVDGILATHLDSGHCSHTDVNQTKAWWKVDLGQVFRIQMINITYRHDFANRLKGYSLYVTNHTGMTRPDGSISGHDGHLCYHDNGPGLPTFNQTRRCHVAGQYVVFYNIRPNEQDAFIELCEVQVYGCPLNRFGYNCGGTCHCKTGGCDPDTGQCDVKGCQRGWMGLSCSLRCHCDGGVACDIDTGACPGGRCQSGWSGHSCFVGSRDLAHGKQTQQSSTYSDNMLRFGPQKAVDGVITRDVVPQGSCSHTDPYRRHPDAWWEVDLGSVQWTQSINIVYRQQYIFQMSGFYLYVSNTSIAHNIHQVLRTAHLCYHDHGPGLPSYIQSLFCPVSGRYVIFYNKRPADYEPADVMYYNTTTAIIELCEVQVLGACTNHKFARDCTQICHCANSDCDRRTGVCKVPGCMEGWRGDTCSQVCSRHAFGRDCNQTCHCANYDCDRRTGVCDVPGCMGGWKGLTCSQVCTNHTFGRDCTQTCHCANSDCDRRTGLCKVPGCTEGWKGDTCSQACTNHTFGRDCTKTCHCANSDCDGRTGVCKVPGCTEGWKGDSCSEPCNYHTFGRDCNQTCHCANSDCDGRTGVCNVPGCMEGWIGRTCSQGCQTGLFGPGCSEECHCRIPGCNHINGACNIMGCEAGFSGQACNQPCTNHTFGRDCNQTCHCAYSDCDWKTGVCKVPGCLGWIGNSCSQAQKQPGATTKIGHGEEQTIHTQCTTGYAVFGSLLAVSISCNIGFIVYCLRMRGRGNRTPPPSSELHTYHMPNHDGNYDGLDSTKIDTTRNVYDTIGRQSD